jgi:hypothetical protein
MIDSFIGACETLVRVVSGKGKNPTSRISRVGMPNGFFLNDLLWFGDGASKKTAISRGFMAEPGEISAFSVTQLNDLHERLRILLGILGEEFALQVQWSIDSDYRQELEAYHRETSNLRRQDPVHGQFGVLIRAERYERYKTAMEEGRLRRERLTLFFTRIIDTKVPIAGYPVVAEYFDVLSRKESLGLCEFAMGHSRGFSPIAGSLRWGIEITFFFTIDFSIPTCRPRRSTCWTYWIPATRFSRTVCMEMGSPRPRRPAFPSNLIATTTRYSWCVNGLGAPFPDRGRPDRHGIPGVRDHPECLSQAGG